MASCQFLGLPVPQRRLHAAQPQLAHSSLWQRLSVGVHHPCLNARQGPPYRYAVTEKLLSTRYFIERGIHRTLRWPVGIEDPEGGRRTRMELFTAQADILHRRRQGLVQQHQAQARGETAARHPVVTQENAQPFDVGAQGFRNNQHRPSHGERGKKVFHRGIKRERGMARYAAVLGQPPFSGNEMYEIEQGALPDDNTLRLAGRAGSVNHIGGGI